MPVPIIPGYYNVDGHIAHIFNSEGILKISFGDGEAMLSLYEVGGPFYNSNSKWLPCEAPNDLGY